MNLGCGSWHIVTGEYTPRFGGISDYSRIVAEGLAEEGADVHVWTSAVGHVPRIESTRPGVTVHRETEGWSWADLQCIGQLIDRYPRPRRILLQFAPNAFHRTGLNASLARWLRIRRSLGDEITIMFHEVTYIVKPGDGLRRRLLALAQRKLAARLLGAADNVDIAIPYWECLLRPLDPVASRTYRWLPVGSNVPVVNDSSGVAAIRSRLGSTVIGSFGTFAADVSQMLSNIIPQLLLDHADCSANLIGNGSDRVAEAWLELHPELKGRVFATGTLPLEEISLHLQACDVLIQPFPGGVCSKRTTLMAGLAHGIATVTTAGEVTESIWGETGATALAPEGDVRALIEQAESLLIHRDVRAQLARAGRALYNNRFASRHTTEALIADDAKSTPAEIARS